VRSVKAQILDDRAMVPQYDGVEAFSFRLTTIHEQMQAFQAGNDGQNVVSNIQSMVFPIIKMGQKALDVTWEGQGREFQIKLIYDENGIVYDNLLSNLAFIEVEALPSETPPRPPARAKAASATARPNQSWSTRFLDLTIKWAWGSTRGKIQMDHYVITCDGWRSFCDDGGAVNASHIALASVTVCQCAHPGAPCLRSPDRDPLRAPVTARTSLRRSQRLAPGRRAWPRSHPNRLPRNLRGC
jgi:hypothetical protein